MPINGKRILVTGGAGFIGTNLVEAMASGNEVTVLDNMHTGKEENIKPLISEYGVNLVKGSSGSAETAMKDPDIIFHLGMYSSAPMYKEHNEYLSEVVADAVKLFRYAAAKRIKVVFASTSSIYNGHKPPHRESMVPFVTDFYTEARIAVERLAELYSKMHGLSAVGLRFMSVYGPHEESKGRYANLISQFLWDGIAGKEPVVYGDGSQERDFIYVKDIVSALETAAQFSAAQYAVFNAGTGKSYSLNKMIERLNAVAGLAIKPKYIKNPVANYVQVTQADTEKAEKELGFRARYGLDEGLKETFEYYSNIM